jgi:type IV pilus assembly protein PilY1
MTYPFASTPYPVDINGDGLTDKVYIGDLGGQMWRLGNFKDMVFPARDQNVNKWKAQVIFNASSDLTSPAVRKFFYPPTATAEKGGFDLVFMATGDRDDPCTTNPDFNDRIYAVADRHEEGSDAVLDVTDLNNATNVADAVENFVDYDGWYIEMASGEKALSSGTVFYGVYYLTTFVPITDDPCALGGKGKLWGIAYRSGGAVAELGFAEDGERSTGLGGSIPSKPVLVLTDEGAKLLISVGTTEADDDGSGGTLSLSTGAGVVSADPLMNKNFFELWWKELH